MSPAFPFEVQTASRSAGRGAAVIADIAARPINRRRRLAAEDPVEEVWTAAATTETAIAGIHADRHLDRLRRRVRRPLDGNIGDATLAALHDLQHPCIAAVDVVAELQFAVGIDESGLVGEVHPDRPLEIDVDLAVAVHLLD